jgi:hypothetical protein
MWASTLAMANSSMPLERTKGFASNHYRTVILRATSWAPGPTWNNIGFCADAEEIRIGLANLNKALNDLISKEVQHG